MSEKSFRLSWTQVSQACFISLKSDFCSALFYILRNSLDDGTASSTSLNVPVASSVVGDCISKTQMKVQNDLASVSSQMDVNLEVALVSMGSLTYGSRKPEPFRKGSLSSSVSMNVTLWGFSV